MFQSQSPTRTNIEEANKHLKMLYSRVDELENKVQSQAEALVQKDREFQTAVTDVNRQKDSEIADLKRTVAVFKRQNHNIHKKLLERDAMIQDLSKKCCILDKLARHRDSLQQVVKLIDSFNIQGSGDNCIFNVSAKNSSDILDGNHLNASADGVDADESDQSSEERPESIKQLTESFSRSNIRHFSISEDDSADDQDTIFRKMKRERELYF